MTDRYVNSNEKKKIKYLDANNLYGSSMSQPLPDDEIKFYRNVKLENILYIPDSPITVILDISLKLIQLIQII